MKRAELAFARPETLAATAPPEARGLARDAVRLLVTAGKGAHRDARFRDLPSFLREGDLVVVNESATVPASLPATGAFGDFTLNLCTRYAPDVWLAEPRWSSARPGPLPVAPGDRATLADGTARVRFVAPYPGLPRLWWVRADADLADVARRAGEPVRYGYVKQARPLEDYQTIFARVPGSAEMPSAARPFTKRTLRDLARRGVGIARIVLHTGVSSLEVEHEDVDAESLYPEPFRVPRETADVVNATHDAGGRVVAVGTTVVRALETAWDGARVRAADGFTRRFVRPGRGPNVVDGLLTGLHDPVTTHLALLAALAGVDVVREAYRHAVERRYLWHEFGDSHLLWSGGRATLGKSGLANA